MPIVRDRLGRLWLAALVVLPPLSCARPATAQAPVRPLQVEDLAAGIELLGAETLSPDGKLVAYTGCDRKEIKLDPRKPELETNRPAAGRTGCSVRVADATTGRSRPVIFSKGESWGPAWSPDGRLLAFYADRGLGPQLWLWERRRGHVRRLTTAIADGHEAPIWASDGLNVMVKLPLSNPANAEASRRGSLSSPPGGSIGRLPSSTVRILGSGTYEVRQDGTVRSDRERSPETDSSWHIASVGAIAIVTVRTGGMRILAPGARSNCYRFSPDGSQIAYTDSRGRLQGEEGASTLSYVYDLVVVDVATAKARVLVSGIRQWEGRAFSWSPDGKWLAYLSGSTIAFPDYWGYTVRGSLHVAATSGGPSRNFHRADNAPEPSFRLLYPEQIPLWDPSGDRIYLTDSRRIWRAIVTTMELTPVTLPKTLVHEAILQSGDETRIWEPHDDASLYFVAEDSVTKRSGIYNANLVTGTTTALWDENKRFEVIRPSGSSIHHRLVLRVQSATESPDLWVADVDSMRMWQLTTLNSQLGRYTFGTSRLVSYHSMDGVPLQAALLLPANYVQGRRYPLIVRVYAGNLGSRKLNEFGMDVLPAYNGQVFSTRGYVLLWPDIPVHAGTPLQDITKAVLPAIDRMVELGVVDPDRVGIMGQSYGGYSTLALLTQTRRFKAGVMIAGVGNLVSLYGVATPSGEGTWISFLEAASGAMRAPPWDVPQRYIENSPIFYLDRVHTPLLMQVGGADQEFVSLSNEIFVGLKRLGRDVTYLRYDGEGHFLQQWANIADYWNRVLEFFGDHLMSTNTTVTGSRP